ncbi:MAG TPA: hypothetical protein VGH44_04185 [Candidatus Saccharimonadia bacterium]|jgi:hypothetical protein
MDPQNPGYPPVPQNSNQPSRLGLLAGLAVIIIVILAVVFFLKPPQPTPATAKFSVSTITPSQTSVTTQTTAIAIKFNRSLATGSASVASNPEVVSATSISGDTLTLTLKPRTLISLKAYVISVKSISSTTGDQLTNQQISFTPSFAPPTTTGQDALTNVGLSNDQVINVMTYISQFDPWAKAVDINDGSLRHFRLNPSDAWSPWAVSFTADIDGTNYTVVGNYYDTEHIQIKISSPSGQQLFTAGTPGSI